MEISKKAAQAIVYAINYHLEEAGLSETRTARLMAVSLASDIKRIMAEEYERQDALYTMLQILGQSL